MRFLCLILFLGNAPLMAQYQNQAAIVVSGGRSSSASYQNVHAIDHGITGDQLSAAYQSQVGVVRFLIELRSLGEPGISIAPLLQRSLAGEDAEFSASLTNLQPDSVQWFFNDILIQNATNLNLRLTGTTRLLDGRYSVIATAGSVVVSNTANLRVLAPQRIHSISAANGNLQISFGDDSGAPFPANLASRFTVEVSTNLNRWVPISTNGAGITLANGQLTFQSEIPNNGPRFYRVIER